MGFVIRAYGRDGEGLCEFENPLSCKRAFALNKSTLATFELPLTHPKAKAEYLTKGTRIIIASDLGLETWGGFIIKRNWASDRLTITCTSQEAMLQRRVTRIQDFENKHVGEIVAALLASANSREHTHVLPGTVDLGGQPISVSYRYDEVYKVLTDLIETAKMEWTVEYENPNQWNFNLYTRRGGDKTASVVLMLGYDIEQAADYEEDETSPANSVFAIGGGSDWNTKLIAAYEDVDAVRDYGLAEATAEPHDLTDYTSLLHAARAEVEGRRYPRRALKLELNNNRNLFREFSEGDIIAAHLPGYAFSGLVVPLRVLGREVDEQQERMTLAAEVVEGEQAQVLEIFTQAHYGSGGGSRGVVPAGMNPY